mgnify:CR=1 FL=1
MNLEKMLMDSVENNTPNSIKEDKIFNYNDKNSFTFKLTKELVEKLNLKSWFAGYKKEAMVSTAGIRGPQNILYPHDTRFPINTIGITLATLAKALVLKENTRNILRPTLLSFRDNSVIDLGLTDYSDLEIVDVLKSLDNRCIIDYEKLKMAGF